MGTYTPSDWLADPTPRLEEQTVPPFCFYGLLSDSWNVRDFEALGDFAGAATLAGCIYDVGAFPALVLPEDGVDAPDDRVSARLWLPAEGCEEAACRVFDRIEGYDPENLNGSLYLRQLVTLLDPPDLEAWVYVWNGPTEGLQFIPSGSWWDWRRLP